MLDRFKFLYFLLLSRSLFLSLNFDSLHFISLLLQLFQVFDSEWTWLEQSGVKNSHAVHFLLTLNLALVAHRPKTHWFWKMIVRMPLFFGLHLRLGRKGFIHVVCNFSLELLLFWIIWHKQRFQYFRLLRFLQFNFNLEISMKKRSFASCSNSLVSEKEFAHERSEIFDEDEFGCMLKVCLNGFPFSLGKVIGLFFQVSHCLCAWFRKRVDLG